MRRRTALLVLALLAASVRMPARAEDRPAALVFCHEDQDAYPWVLKDRPGLNILLLQQVARELALRIDFVAMPWKRCLAELEGGRVDGAFAASFRPERAEMGLFPGMEGGRPDAARRLHTNSYSLYRLRDDGLRWDGRQFANLRGPIGVLSGFSIGDLLREKGAEVDEGSKSPVDTLRKLLAGRVQGVALQTPRAEHALRSYPGLAARIVREDLPLEERAYYLMLSRPLAKRHPALPKDIWDAVARVRESAEYRRAEAAFYARS